MESENWPPILFPYVSENSEGKIVKLNVLHDSGKNPSEYCEFVDEIFRNKSEMPIVDMSLPNNGINIYFQIVFNSYNKEFYYISTKDGKTENIFLEQIDGIVKAFDGNINETERDILEIIYEFTDFIGESKKSDNQLQNLIFGGGKKNFIENYF